MTSTGGETAVRYLINQTNASDSLFSTNFIQNLLNQGRRMFAVILPSKIIPNLIGGESTAITITSGVVPYPSDFLRPLKDKVVKIGATTANIIAQQILPGDEWRLKFLEINDLTKSGSASKYYRETGRGIEAYPTTDTKMIYPYIKKPTILSGVDNAELPLDVDDMVIDFAFEKLMGTPHGSDYELAKFLAINRGYLEKKVAV